MNRKSANGLSSTYDSRFTIYEHMIYDTSMTIPFIEENDQTRARREHLEKLREIVGNVYPNKFERSHVTGDEDTITAVAEKFKAYEPQVKEGERPAPEEVERANAELNKIDVRLSGRIATPPRLMGKAAFVHLSDGVSRLQIYVRKADVKGIHNDDNAPVEEGWELFNLLDHGDFIGIAGYLFVTKTGELSVHVRDLQFLAKALLPMPDKMHGIADPEIRQRQRYADLIAGSLKVEKDEEGDSASRELSSREVFTRRSKIIREMRRYLDDHGYIEVETPMLSPKATGAVARPFVTHHNALDIDLYARIAPELYLKRLVVGGFEKVYELNRNFRNEGIDRTHNPEFTMLEFYQAYMDVNGMMDFCEEMIRETVQAVVGRTIIRFGNVEIDFGKRFSHFSMKKSIQEVLSKFEGFKKQQVIQLLKFASEFNEILDDTEKEFRDFCWLDDPQRIQTVSEYLTIWKRWGNFALDDSDEEKDESFNAKLTDLWRTFLKGTWEETKTKNLSQQVSDE
ncbi:MAG TPA: amino acid--tRNA ligase-related protein, partial [Pyrinomonadaceae bacterium]|nr:amino acid--tRNA ligase-related protein [Pyrinomonadaceae bacterium]